MASFKEKLDKNGNRIYEVQASNGRGRRVWRTFRPEPTWSKRTIERELQKFAAELEQQLADGEVLTREETAQKAAAEAVEAAKIKTFRQYAEAVYLPEKAAMLAEKTRASYTQLLEQHVFPALGHVLLPEITPAMIKALLSSLSEELAFASVTKVYAVLHNLFKAALLDDTIDRNPMDKVPRPRKSKDAALPTEHKAFTAEETRYILRCLDGEPLKWRAFILLLIDTGCRRGEACGLQWQSVDFDTNTITIERNLQYTSERGVYETLPKNGKTRVIAPAPYIMQVLKKHKIAQAEQRLLMGDLWNPGEFPNLVFTHKDGSHYSQPTIWKEFQDILAAAGLEHHRVHDLRHPYVKPTTKKFASFLKFFRAAAIAARSCSIRYSWLMLPFQISPFLKSPA